MLKYKFFLNLTNFENVSLTSIAYISKAEKTRFCDLSVHFSQAPEEISAWVFFCWDRETCGYKTLGAEF
jgi:hypothetical protein